MTDDRSTSSSATAWPLPKFSFEVRWDDAVMAFQEASGLNAESQAIEYRAGTSPAFSTAKMPGIKKFSNVTLKKGVLKADKRLWDWFNQIKMNAVRRETITISLLDETGQATMVWTLANAWPTEVTGTDLKAEGNEVAVETLELAFEDMIIAAP